MQILSHPSEKNLLTTCKSNKCCVVTYSTHDIWQDWEMGTTVCHFNKSPRINNQHCWLHTTYKNVVTASCAKHGMKLLLLLLHLFNGLFSRKTWVSQHQKGKAFWILLKQEMMGGFGISWTICRSFAPGSIQITMPASYHSVFTGRMTFLIPNQQRQSTEGMETHTHNRFMALWNFYGTTRVSRYQKKHSPTHTHRGHQSSLSAFSIYYDPWHRPYSIHGLYSLFPQSLSKFSLVYLLAWYPPLHTSIMKAWKEGTINISNTVTL